MPILAPFPLPDGAPLAVPVAAIMENFDTQVRITFSRTLSIVGLTLPEGWFACNGNILVPQVIEANGTDVIVFVEQGFTPCGSLRVSYDGTQGQLIDDLGRPVPAFIDFPLTIG
ncbi:MAG TPA: hypothetical protein VNT79_02125 [Phycisphaerae bacterium]|nr:hypothetical protein [Phycisphaerae bacterium]